MWGSRIEGGYKLENSRIKPLAANVPGVYGAWSELDIDQRTTY